MKITIDNYEFITFKYENAEFTFSTAKNNLNFNKNTMSGKENLRKLRKYFNLKDVGYMNQIHSSIVNEFDGKIPDGDALITNKRNVGIGIFTADCVPVLIYDKKTKATAAVHSGWKGTSEEIASKCIQRMIKEFNSNPNDLIVYIGPHNRNCCYEFGSDAAYKYFGKFIDKDKGIFTYNKLDLEKCIIMQLKNIGVPYENINTLNLCTHCSHLYEFYSYRRDKNSGRMFSFIVIR